MILLHTLPYDDLLRNTKLKELGAEVRNKQGKTWRPVATWKIGNSTYNELGPVWTELNEFRMDAN